MNYKYYLDKSSKKFVCPECGKKRFVRYKNSQTDEYAPEQYGVCDRKEECGYKQYPTSEKSDDWKRPTATPKPQAKPQPQYISVDVFKQSLSNYDKNTFIKWLVSVIGKQETEKLIKMYYLGTNSYSDFCRNAVIFWQIDTNMRIHRGKIMQYQPNGHRQKENGNYSVHNALKLGENKAPQTLFGLHLIKDTTKKIAVTESEKTALVASVFKPDFIWLACGSLQNIGFNTENQKAMYQPLKNRDVIFYPDAGCFDKWIKKANELKSICRSIEVSDILERCGAEKGKDIADYLILI